MSLDAKQRHLESTRWRYRSRGCSARSTSQSSTEKHFPGRTYLSIIINNVEQLNKTKQNIRWGRSSVTQSRFSFSSLTAVGFVHLLTEISGNINLNLLSNIDQSRLKKLSSVWSNLCVSEYLNILKWFQYSSFCSIYTPAVSVCVCSPHRAILVRLIF